MSMYGPVEWENTDGVIVRVVMEEPLTAVGTLVVVAAEWELTVLAAVMVVLVMEYELLVLAVVALEWNVTVVMVSAKVLVVVVAVQF